MVRIIQFSIWTWSSLDPSLKNDWLRWIVIFVWQPRKAVEF